MPQPQINPGTMEYGKLDYLSSLCFFLLPIFNLFILFLFGLGISRLAQRNPSIKCLRIAGTEEHAGDNGMSSRSQDAYQQKSQEIVDIAAALQGKLVTRPRGYETFFSCSTARIIFSTCLLAKG